MIKSEKEMFKITDGYSEILAYIQINRIIAKEPILRLKYS